MNEYLLCSHFFLNLLLFVLGDIRIAMHALEHHLGKADGGGVVHFVWVWRFIL
jgi:hypothetical protein